MNRINHPYDTSIIRLSSTSNRNPVSNCGTFIQHYYGLLANFMISCNGMEEACNLADLYSITYGPSMRTLWFDRSQVIRLVYGYHRHGSMIWSEFDFLYRRSASDASRTRDNYSSPVLITLVAVDSERPSIWALSDRQRCEAASSVISLFLVLVQALVQNFLADVVSSLGVINSSVGRMWLTRNISYKEMPRLSWECGRSY